jgi:hypothetical protein
MANPLRFGCYGTFCAQGGSGRRTPIAQAVRLSSSDHDFARVPSERCTSPRLAARRYGRCQRLCTDLSKPAGWATYSTKGTSHKLTESGVLSPPDQIVVTTPARIWGCSSSSFPSVITEPSLVKTECESRPCATRSPGDFDLCRRGGRGSNSFIPNPAVPLCGNRARPPRFRARSALA